MKKRHCKLCDLSVQCRGPVWGQGDPTCRLWFIGEAPGADEDLSGIPFCGKAGDEKKMYERRAGLHRVESYTTNLVKCRPPQNRDPEPDEIAACQVHLMDELAQMPGDAVVATLGRFSTESLLGDVDMELVHGIPQRHPKTGVIIVPTYHPALGLYSGRNMTYIQQDFQAVADALFGRISPNDWIDKVDPQYIHVRGCPSPILGTMKPDVVAVDTEFIPGEDNKPWSIQLSFREGEGYLVRANDLGALEWAKGIIESPETLTVMHNAQTDLVILDKLGIHPARWADTMLMAHLLCDLSKALKVLAYRLCGMKMRTYHDLTYKYNNSLIVAYLEEVAAIEWPKPEPVLKIEHGVKKWKNPWPHHRKAARILKDVERGKCTDPYERWLRWDLQTREEIADNIGAFLDANISDVPFDEALEYACADPDATLRVFRRLLPRVKAEGLWGSLERDQRAVQMVIDMEQTGVGVSSDELLDLRGEFEAEKDDLIETIKGQVNYYINPGSPQQCNKLIYKDLRIRVPRMKVKNSTSEEVLSKIQDKHPVIKNILRYREVDKVRQFVDRLVLLAKKDGRIHDDFSFIRTATGRLAASILMTIPHHSKEGQALRNCFVAGPGRTFISGDYSQIELRVLAHMSGDDKLIKIFHDGVDIHSRTASDIFGIPIEQLDKHKHRFPAKTVNFGIVYGMSADGLYDELGKHGWSKTDCEKFIIQWFQLYPGAKKYLEWAWTHARRYGYVRCLLGRKRLIPEVKSAHFFVRQKGLRNAGNTPIQGSAQEIMKQAMGDLVPLYKTWGSRFYIKPLIQLHDDLLWEADTKRARGVAKKIKQVMETAVELKVPVRVDMQIGDRWSSMEELQ